MVDWKQLKRSFDKSDVFLLVIVLAVLIAYDNLVGIDATDFLTGDLSFHIGWANQLILGKTIPYNFYSGAPNHYPWLFHATLGFLAQSGGCSTIESYKTMTMLQIIIFMLSPYVLARYVFQQNKSVGLLAVFYTWLAYSPSLFRPSYPRDFSLGMMIASLFLVTKSLNERDKILPISSGICLGILGLLYFNAFVVLMLSLCVVSIVYFRSRGFEKMKVLLSILTTATIVSSIFYVPLLINYLKYGAIIDVEQKLAVSSKIFSQLARSIYQGGFIWPLSLIGAVIATRLKRSRFMIAVVAVLVTMIVLQLPPLNSVLPIIGLWTFGLEYSRLLPLLRVLLGSFAAVGLLAAFKFVARNQRIFAAIFLLVLLILGAYPIARHAPLPGIGTYYIFQDSAEQIKIKNHELLDKENIFTVMKKVVTNNDVVFAPVKISRKIWVLTGTDVVWVPRNRIRWKGVFETKLIPQNERSRDTTRIYSRDFQLETLESILEKYNVTYFIAEMDQVAKISEFKNLELVDEGEYEGERYYVYKVVG